jgi:hypothetical protein
MGETHAPADGPVGIAPRTEVAGTEVAGTGVAGIHIARTYVDGIGGAEVDGTGGGRPDVDGTGGAWADVDGNDGPGADIVGSGWAPCRTSRPASPRGSVRPPDVRAGASPAAEASPCADRRVSICTDDEPTRRALDQAGLVAAHQPRLAA